MAVGSIEPECAASNIPAGPATPATVARAAGLNVPEPGSAGTSLPAVHDPPTAAGAAGSALLAAVAGRTLEVQSLAQALRRRHIEGAAAVSRAAAAPRALPRGPAEARLSTPQLRADRPLGAPVTVLRSAAERPEDAAERPEETSSSRALVAIGRPVIELPPVIVEPQVDPLQPAVTRHLGDRPLVRNRRLYRRVALDADIEIDGAVAKLLALSMGGFGAANAPPLAPDRIVPVTIKMSIDGVDLSTRMRARMVYATTRRSGGRFVGLTASQTAFLRYIVGRHGQAVGALGTTTLLHAIAPRPESEPADETPAREPRPRRASWWSRWFGRALVFRRSGAAVQ